MFGPFEHCESQADKRAVVFFAISPRTSTSYGESMFEVLNVTVCPLENLRAIRGARFLTLAERARRAQSISKHLNSLRLEPERSTKRFRKCRQCCSLRRMKHWKAISWNRLRPSNHNLKISNQATYGNLEACTSSWHKARVTAGTLRRHENLANMIRLERWL